MTDTNQNEAGVLAVLVQRLETQRLPRALEIKDRLDRGERLTDADMRFLQEILEDAKGIAPLVSKQPEVQTLASRVTSLYSEITAKALENEKAG